MRAHRSILCTIAVMLVSVWSGSASADVITPDHIVIVMEENHSYSEIIGSPNAPYINGLVSQGALLTNSFAVAHPSQPNYLALFSGSTQGVTSDSVPSGLPFTTTNLGAQLIASGRTFTGYSESEPSVGYTGATAGGSSGYVRKHNPWVNWQQTGGPPYPANTLPTSVNVPYSQFPTNYATLPTVSFVVPTMLDDMHDGTIAQGDTWLSNNLNGYVQWAKTHNSLFILTWDEDDSSSSNQVATILVGQQVQIGVTSNQTINHYNLLGTIQDMYGLARNANSIGTSAITGIWTPVPEPGSLVLLVVGSAGIFGSTRCRRLAHGL